MKMRKLLATKPHRYGTRHLVAGDEYEVPPRHAVALVAGKKAQFADKVARVWKEKPATDAAAAAEFVEYMHSQTIVAHPVEQPPDIDDLRLQATQLGIDVDGRWGLARLQHEIAQAKR